MSELLGAGRSPWLVTPLLAVATLISIVALRTRVQMGEWVSTTVVVFAIVVVAIVVTRMATRRKTVPTIIGAAVAVLVLIPTYARDADDNSFALPTFDGLRALGTTLNDGYHDAVLAEFPTTVENDLATLVTVVFLSLFLVAELLAVSWRYTATAGIPLLAPWGFAVVTGASVDQWHVIASLACWIGAMALTRRDVPSNRDASYSSGILSTAATIGVALIAIPSAMFGNGWGILDRFNAAETFVGDTTRLNLALDLRNSLTTNSQNPQFAYQSSGDRPGAFRLYSFSDFNGISWDRDPTAPTPRLASQGVLWPENVSEWNDADRVSLDISVFGLTENHLPVPTTPRTVDVAGAWTYNATTDEIVGNGVNTRDLIYTVVTEVGYHSAAELQAASDLLASDPTTDISDPRFTEIAPTIDLERIRTLATQVTFGADTRYDQTMLVQAYLRNSQNFQYDTSVDPSVSGDAVSSFLTNRAGYCVQFASTMIIMLRSLDIPARLGVGFLPGSPFEDDVYVVAGGDAHAWPEVYFPGQGWVRFEPTPSIQTGAPPAWADPFTGDIPVPREVLDGGQFPTDSGALGDPASGTNQTEDPAETPAGRVQTWLIALLAAVGAGAGMAATFWWRRGSGRAHRRDDGPEAAWTHLREGIGEFAWPLSMTPAEARTHVERGIRAASGLPLSEHTAQALGNLSQAVSLFRYGPHGVEVSSGHLDDWVANVTTAARAASDEARVRLVRGASRSARRGG